jgi:hypothetical protein
VTGAPSPDVSLGFRAAVLEDFSLLPQWGFAVVEARETLVMYEGKGFSIDVRHDTPGHDIDVDIGELLDPDVHCLLSEIVRTYGGDLSEWVMASTPERVRRGVLSAVRAFCRYGMPMIAEGLGEFARRAEGIRRYANWFSDYRVEERFRKADSAWRARDFSELVRVYAELSDSGMTALDVGRLEYARRRAK